MQRNRVVCKSRVPRLDPIRRRIYCPTCRHGEFQYCLQIETTHLLLTHEMMYAIYDTVDYCFLRLCEDDAQITDR